MKLKVKRKLAGLLSALMAFSIIMSSQPIVPVHAEVVTLSVTFRSEADKGEGTVQYKATDNSGWTDYTEGTQTAVAVRIVPNGGYKVDWTGIQLKQGDTNLLETDSESTIKNALISEAGYAITSNTALNDVEFGVDNGAGGGGGDPQPAEPGTVSFKCQDNAVTGGHIWYKLDGDSNFTMVAETAETNSYASVNVSASNNITLKFEPNGGYTLDAGRGVNVRVNGASKYSTTGNEAESFTGNDGVTIDLSDLLDEGRTVANSSFEVEFGFGSDNGGNDPQPGGGGHAGSGASKEYNFDGNKTSTIHFSGTDLHDGAGLPVTAIYYINGADAQERSYDEGSQMDIVTQKPFVTYPYNAADPATPKVGGSHAVEFEFVNQINMRYTEIKINGVDYSSQIPGSNEATREWDILEAMDLNGQSQTISFILTVPYADTYNVTANMEIIGSESTYGSGADAIHFQVRNAINGTVGYKYDTYNYPDISANDVTYPSSLTPGKTFTIYAKPNDGFELDYFGMKFNGVDVDWDTIGNPNRDDLVSESGLSFVIPDSMADGVLEIMIEFTCSEEQIDAQNRYFPTGNFLWSNLEEDAGSDQFLDHTLVEFVSFSYQDRAGQTITYDNLEDMNNANHAYLSFSEDPNRGEATLIAGGKLTVRLVPRYGYQVVTFGPNGGAFGSNPDKVAEYTFTIANGNCHLGATCAPVEDKVATSSTAISTGSIGINAENADEFSMGTAVLSVDDVQPTATDVSGFTTAANGYSIDSYLDLNLNNVVYRGSEEDVWSTEITDLTNEATISLTVSEELPDDVEIVHQKHDGTYEVISATYDAAAKTVTFKTDSFSKYAIAYKTTEKDPTPPTPADPTPPTPENPTPSTPADPTPAIPDNGWYVKEDGTKVLYKDGKIVTSQWYEEDTAWYYLDDTGVAVTDWKEINSIWYYFNKDAVMQTGWQEIDGTWYYLDSSGAMLTGWQLINGTWYYFQSNGKMAESTWIGGSYVGSSGAWVQNPVQEGWKQSGNKWWYQYADATYPTSTWKGIGGTWYYFDADGWMATGWKQINNDWFYFDASGAMKTGWLQNGGTWYYLTNSGAMATGWINDGGTWYYLTESGAMKTGWLKLDDNWYYLDASGSMKTGWFNDGGTWYYLKESGEMAYDTVIDGYTLNKDGAWIE